MHILHIYKDYYPVLGGIENHLRVLAEGLAQRGHRVTVLATNTAAHDDIQRHGDLTVIKAGRVLHLASTPFAPRMLWHAQRLRDVDLVHLHFPFPPGDLVARAVPHSPPLVVGYHSDIVRQQRLLRVYGPLLRQTLSHAARIIASNPAYVATSPWLHAHAAKCSVVPYGINVRRFAHAEPAAVAALRARFGGPLVLFVGRLRYYKGVHVLLEALAQVQADAHLLIVGIGPEAHALQAQAAAAGLDERVHFLGETTDRELATVYAAANVFVLPSHLRAEAFGIVQVEAQAAGLPIVCAELGTGTSYVTLHGRTGFVVPPNEPLALARAVNVLLANPTLARQLGIAGRVRAEREFSRERMIAQMEQVYREVVASGHT